EQCIKDLYYGYNDSAIHLRLDFKPDFTKIQNDFEIRVNIGQDHPARVHARITRGELSGVEFWRNGQQASVHDATGAAIIAAYSEIFEATLSYAALGLEPGQTTCLQVALWLDQLPVQVLPNQGWLALELSEYVAGW
ncbi:MAG: hypothetical protein ACRD10_14480, partial [Terriglobia bacterium]